MSQRYQTVEFIAESAGERLDKALAARFEQLSRAQVQTLMRDGQVTVDGQPVKPSYRIEGGEQVQVQVPLPDDDARPQPEAIPLDVLYEDDALAAINKPAGMVVHPAYGHRTGTLVNAALARWPQLGDWPEPERAGIVHRLDKDTSGVILIAKTETMHAYLQDQFKARAVHKRYLALVEGTPDTPEGLIEAPIGRDPKRRKRMRVIHDGRAAITEFRIAEYYQDFSLLEAFPQTGRTHQIRVHMAFIGHPVVGDTIYGRRKQRIKMKRHFLHAASILLTLPGDVPLTVEAPLPEPLQDVLRKLPR